MNGTNLIHPSLAMSWRDEPRQRPSMTGLIVVLALHLAVLFVLCQPRASIPPVQPVLLSATLLAPMVLPQPAISAPTLPIEPPKPQLQPTPPQPKKVVSRVKPSQKPSQVAAPSETPAVAETAPVATVPAEATPPSPPIAIPPAAKSELTEPRFDADYLDNPKPAYPSISRRLGEQGRVLLRVQVDERGLAREVELHTSSGHPRLDTIALQTVRRWKFVPARLGEQKVAATVLVPIVFSLKG
ncbi:MAG TPA: energy transducer TonB [Pseudomonadales bacterium]|nr:energy transducer TonB [Pseudomonadales bacterium]